MLIFLLVLLALGTVLEALSLRSGTADLEPELTLSQQRAEPGEQFSVTTAVKNAGRLPVTYLCLHVAYPLHAQLPEGVQTRSFAGVKTVSDVYRLWLRQRISHTMQLRIEKRGVHGVGIESMERGDFLGLHSVSTNLTKRSAILIYPKRLENAALKDSLGSFCGDLTARRWLLQDPVLTRGVREYTGQESMHTISWSQSARRGELMVREFEYTRSLSCCVLLCADELTLADDTVLDLCCSAARTVCETLCEHGVEAQLYTNAVLIGYSGTPVRRCTAAPGRMQDMLDLLARAGLRALCPMSEMADGCLREQSDAAAWVLITPHRTAQAEQTLQRLSEAAGAGALLVTADELEGVL